MPTRNTDPQLVAYVKEELAKLETLTKRLNTTIDRGRSRNEFHRDYTRIMYSSSFRRLQGKMQLLGVQTDKFYRNRLTHSLEVSQIARSIAERLGYDSTYVVEAAALAHDIGNPPFGHYGERIMDELASRAGGFEGNAQTLRVLMRIEKKNPESCGLNLTLRTLLGVTKYYKKRTPESKKFIYDEDYDELTQHINENDVNVRTLDVQIMDLADEIAYAAHDLEDGLSLKLFTVDELIYEYHAYINKEYGEKSQGDLGLEKFMELVDESKKFAYKSSNFRSSEEYSFMLRKELLGKIVNTLVNDIELCEVSAKDKETTGTTHDKELDFKQYATMAKALKMITFKCINRSSVVQIYEKQGETIIRSLYDMYMDEKFNAKHGLLPPEYRTDVERDKERIVTDYIAGMMESYATSTYQKYFGKSALERVYQEYKNNEK